jgi:hypothetical protein
MMTQIPSILLTKHKTAQCSSKKNHSKFRIMRVRYVLMKVFSKKIKKRKNTKSRTLSCVATKHSVSLSKRIYFANDYEDCILSLFIK